MNPTASHVLMPVHCPDCGVANAADRKFCSGCGRGLWEACLSCGTVNGAWEKFCGVCGSNLEAILEEQTGRFKALLAQADSLRKLCRHSEAIEELARAPTNGHSALAPYARRCQELAEQLRAELERLELEREGHFASAQQCFTERKYDEAAAALGRIHRRLRSPPMQELLDRLRGILEELPALEKEIRDAVEERRTQGILSKVQRYLELRPDNRAMCALAEKLETFQQRQFEARRNQLLTAAKQKVAEHEYAAAASLVDQVHASVRTPEVEKFFDYCRNRAHEVAWLAEDLKDIAQIDEHLVPLADRLQKLRPADENVTKLAGRVRRLRQEHSAVVRSFVPSRTPSSLGWPIEGLEGFRQIDDERIRASDAYINNSTCFYVAAGLAVQGLNQAALSINLLPDQKKGLLESLATSVLKKRAKAAWGIDIGNYALKAIKLGLKDESATDPKLVALACEYLPYTHSLMHPGSSPEMLIREVLEKFLKTHDLANDSVCLSYPVAKTLARFISLPPCEKKKVPELIKYEARQQIPFPLESVTWDYQVTWSSGDDGTLAEREVSLFALKTDEAHQLLFPFQELKIKVDILQAENVALHNYLACDYYAAFEKQFANENESPRDQVVAALDIGANSSNLVIGNRHSLWVRNIPLGSHHFNRPLVTEFKLTQEQAEQLKRKPSMAIFTSKMYQAMDPLLRDLLSEVRRSLASFEHTYRQRRIKQMVILGGGIRMHGLLRLLRTRAGEQRL